MKERGKNDHLVPSKNPTPSKMDCYFQSKNHLNQYSYHRIND